MPTKSNRCDFLLDNNERCGAKHEMKLVMFRDPYTRETQEVALCPKHFGEVLEEPLLFPIRKLNMKLSSMIAKNNRERQMFRSSDTPFDYEFRKQQVDHLRKQIIHEHSYKCCNVLCGNPLQSTGKVFSMLIFNENGKQLHKFYLCSAECCMKMRHRVGLIKIDLIQVQTLQEFQ